jgi:hypothetical protein
VGPWIEGKSTLKDKKAGKGMNVGPHTPPLSIAAPQFAHPTEHYCVTQQRVHRVSTFEAYTSSLPSFTRVHIFEVTSCVVLRTKWLELSGNGDE